MSTTASLWVKLVKTQLKRIGHAYIRTSWKRRDRRVWLSSCKRVKVHAWGSFLSAVQIFVCPCTYACPCPGTNTSGSPPPPTHTHSHKVGNFQIWFSTSSNFFQQGERGNAKVKISRPGNVHVWITTLLPFYFCVKFASGKTWKTQKVGKPGKLVSLESWNIGKAWKVEKLGKVGKSFPDPEVSTFQKMLGGVVGGVDTHHSRVRQHKEVTYHTNWEWEQLAFPFDLLGKFPQIGKLACCLLVEAHHSLLQVGQFLPLWSSMCSTQVHRSVTGHQLMWCDFWTVWSDMNWRTTNWLTYLVVALADAAICLITIFRHWFWVGNQLKYQIQFWITTGWSQGNPVLFLSSNKNHEIDCFNAE